MADARSFYGEQIEAARLALSRGDRPAAAAAFHAAIELARVDAGLQRERIPALVQLGKLEQELGRPADAERFLAEALETAERQFGAEHASLGPVLNELSRLHLRQGDHARAEVVLERLLRITRTRGEDHPDVATALTGLALVKRALGDDLAAEQRYRVALRIREKALPPHHMAIVVTMEQLSETCAARGNVVEALSLLERALPTREAALGHDHATVRALRSRIAALQLRKANVTVAAAVERFEAPSSEKPEALSANQAAAPAAKPLDVPSPERAAAPTLPPFGRSRRKQVARFASVGVVALAIATAAMSVSSRAGRVGDQAPTPPATALRVAAAPTTAAANGATAPVAPATSVTATPATSATATSATTTDSAIMPPVAVPDSVHSASAPPTPIDSAERARSAAVTPQAPPRLRIAPKTLSAVTAGLIARTNVDSMVRAATKGGRESLTDHIGTGVIQASRLDDGGARPAALVGPAPIPRFPDELRAQWTEGEVVVRFRVDARGRVDASSVKVLMSDHDLFTAAVRNVLPRFRFEPARSAAPESKAIPDWVDYRVQFTAPK